MNEDAHDVLLGLARRLADPADPVAPLRTMEAIFNGLTEAVVVANATGEVILHNRASLVLHGYRPGEAALGPMQAIASAWEIFDMGGNRLPAEAWPLARALRGERFGELTLRVRRNDTGQTFVGRYTGSPIYDEQGRLSLAMITIQDITAWHEAEAEREQLLQQFAELKETLEEQVVARTRRLADANEALEEARDWFYTLFHDSPIATLLTQGEEAVVIDANAAYLDYFGYERDEVLGRPEGDLATFASPAELKRLLARVEREGHAYNMPVRLTDRAGVRRYALASAQSVRLGGQPALLTKFIDITERREAEEKVRRLASQLALAEERERRRIAQVLHDDIQQTLVALQMKLQMGERGTGEEVRATFREAEDYVNMVMDGIRHLSGELAAPSYGEGHLKDNFNWLKGLMAERYGLEVDLDVDDGALIEDEDLQAVVVRLVRELLFNTVKHAGVKQAHLSARRDGERLLIRVEDDGKGFDVAATKGQSSAAGFGLFSIREQLGLFGGELQLDSRPGEGTRATVLIPVTGRG